MDKIRNILSKYKYTVNFEKISSNRFNIKTPRREFHPKQSPRELALNIDQSRLDIFESNKLVQQTELTPAGVRVGIYYLLADICLYLNYNDSFVFYTDGIVQADTMLELLPSIPLDLVKQETILISLVKAELENSISINHLHDDAKNNNLETAFYNILSLKHLFERTSKYE